jgi:hypothetical protein
MMSESAKKIDNSGRFNKGQSRPKGALRILKKKEIPLNK